MKQQSNKPKSPRYFFLITLLIPFLFFILLEIGLRLFNYGMNTNQWIEVADGKLTLNPEIARRYFHTLQNLPTSNQDVFDAQKKQNAFRIFVLGESSGAGYPYLPVGSFSRWLQTRLEILYPQCTIEVVNLSMTAINSYTMRDLFPGVAEQKPDVVLIYAGHNEYYGALGVGSTESFGSNRTVVLLSLFLNKFKTIELLQNTITSVSELIFSHTQARNDGTIMANIAKDQYIEYQSDAFNKGISQFENNMRDILNEAKDHGIPVIFGTVASNLKDQKPFISIASAKLPSAQQVFDRATNELLSKNFQAADSLFRIAKDLDVLRFRAPEEINHTIIQLSKEFNCPVVHIDSVFSAMSPDGISGDNLMTDHLHPTLHGYQTMAKLYFEAMQNANIAPQCSAARLTSKQLDDETNARFHFTILDSVIAVYRIAMLKNDWPYVEKKDRKKLSALITPHNGIEEIALEFLDENEPWEGVQQKAADFYLSKKDYASFQKQMSVLISQYPVIVEYYDYTANELMDAGKYDEAYTFLIKRYAIKPNAYSSKWLGIITLSKNNIADAVKYLEESLKYDSSDPQTWYNISGAYVYNKEYAKALEAINSCLSLDASFGDASNFKEQLLLTMKQK